METKTIGKLVKLSSTNSLNSQKMLSFFRKKGSESEGGRTGAVRSVVVEADVSLFDQIST